MTRDNSWWIQISFILIAEAALYYEVRLNLFLSRSVFTSMSFLHDNNLYLLNLFIFRNEVKRKKALRIVNPNRWLLSVTTYPDRERMTDIHHQFAKYLFRFQTKTFDVWRFIRRGSFSVRLYDRIRNYVLLVVSISKLVSHASSDVRIIFRCRGIVQIRSDNSVMNILDSWELNDVVDPTWRWRKYASSSLTRVLRVKAIIRVFVITPRECWQIQRRLPRRSTSRLMEIST